MADGGLSAVILGAEDLKRSFDAAPKIVEEEFKKAMDKTAIDAECKARGHAPHKTGTLWRSIHHEPAQVTQNNVISKVGTDLVYARAQEYGTQGMMIHSHSRSGQQFSYIGNIPPKYYMKQAKEEVRPLLTRNISDATNKIIRRLVLG